ncbi:MAG TPA: FAD:protein FMN transferase, partial [Bryobacteraceae bacterium]|nr:FAD:protein FMN transferase [Bryobacteraceae bacterium]
MAGASRIALIALVVCCARAAGPSLQPFEAVESHMGTLIRIKLYAADRERAKAGFDAAFSRIAELDASLSDYRAESELNRLCRGPAGHPVKISEDLFRVLAAAQELAAESGGAFDVTLGPVIRMWRQARRDHALPNPAALREAAARTGFHKLHLDEAARTATLDESGMQLDLGGIAKGYAADAALDVLTRMGITSALVAASGDLAFSHAPP